MRWLVRSNRVRRLHSRICGLAISSSAQARCHFERPLIASLSSHAFGSPILSPCPSSAMALNCAGILQHPRQASRSGENGRVSVLAAMRAAQLAMLVLAFVILWKQPNDVGASIGAWLLAALSVYCIAPPSRFSAVWHDLPAPLEAAMWLPYLSSVSVGAIVATFYTVFPQRPPHWRLIVASIWTVMLPLLGLHAYDGWRAMYLPDELLLSTTATRFSVPANFLFVILGALVMVGNYRRLSSPSERRRVRLVLVSSCVALVSASLVITQWVFADHADLTRGMFSSWMLTLGMLPVLTVPVAFSYAILRHRLFDISLILRQGLKYALARRVLLSLIPAAGLLLILDVTTQPNATLAELFGRRIWWYATMAAGVAWVYHRRHDWLEALDRRYFREHYNAQQLLGELAENLRCGGQLLDVAPVVIARIDAALHSSYVAVLVRSDDRRFYECVGSSDSAHRTLRFPAGDKAIRLLALLGQPLIVGRNAPRSVFDQLPDDERRALVANETELLVGVAGPGDTVEGVLALGVKRSEEPYSREDLELLATVALNLRAALPVSDTTEECDSCGLSYASGTGRCSSDGTVLERSDTPRLLAGQVRHRASARPRRHGYRLCRTRYAIEPDRRDQAAARAGPVRVGARAVPPRGAGGSGVCAPQRRHHPRYEADRRRTSVHRHGAAERQDSTQGAVGRADDVPADPSRVRGCLCRTRDGACRDSGTSRPQAGECLPHERRRRRLRCEAARLRHFDVRELGRNNLPQRRTPGNSRIRIPRADPW